MPLEVSNEEEEVEHLTGGLLGTVTVLAGKTVVVVNVDADWTLVSVIVE